MAITFAKFEKSDGLVYGFSNRQDGSMHRHLEKVNRESYFKKIGIDPGRVVTADLNHGTSVVFVKGENAGQMIAETDSLVTNETNLFLSVTAADCFVIYFYDPVKKAIGLTHAGWRGILGGVVKETLKTMAETFGSVNKDVQVGLSPGIRKCHFEISAIDETKFEEYSEAIIKTGEKIFVDPPIILKSQLKQAGVLGNNIEDLGKCTYCEVGEYFSYRRDRPSEVEPMVGCIGLV